MKKFALMTALVTASTIAVPAMADNGYRHNNHDDHRNASNHKYVKYNNGNGNAYGKYKHKKYASHQYDNRNVQYHYNSNMKKWPVPHRPNTMPMRHQVQGQHH